MNTALKVAMASTLALATAVPAMAQSQYQQYQPNQYQQTQDSREAQERYQEQQQQYQNQRDAYDARRSDYDQHREGYQAARNEYERRLAAYNRARRDYDRRYGYGAYVRIYGPAPVWSDRNWAYYAVPAPAYAPAYGANTAYVAPEVRCDNSSTVGAGAIGAIAGALLGSNVAAHGRRTEGAVLGGVVGAGIGAAVGHQHDKYKCDQRGPYFSYNETVPYREDEAYRTPRYAEYQRMRCRLATAPVDNDGRDYRYVRVCPDPDGRYRIVG